jgi:hypothetical protein
MQPLESDWKVFKALVILCRERYLHDRNAALIAMLQSESLTPTERFWATYQRMEEIEKILRECLDSHSRSNMFIALINMYHHQMITDSDMCDFSEELKAKVQASSDL